MIRILQVSALLLVVLVASGRAADQDSIPKLSPDEKALYLESFDHVWTTIYERHFDTTFGGLDWQAAYDELQPQVASAETAAEARRPFFDLISRLGLSHFAIIPASLYDNIDRPAQKGDRGGRPGLDVCVVDSQALVTKVYEGTSAADAGVRPGWEIAAIAGEEIPPLFTPLYEEFENSARLEHYLVAAVTSRLSGPIGDSVRVTFIDGAGATVDKVMELAEPHGKKVLFGHLPPFYLRVKVDTLDGGIGYFGFSFYFDPQVLMTAFNEFMQSSLDAPGIIIDIRGNGGGIGGLAMGMGGWLTNEKNLYLGTLTTRETQLKLIINPRAKTYQGPVAILVDGRSASTSEFFAGGLKDIGRARVFGTRTLGAALPSMIEKLPSGDGFQYAFGHYVSASGKALEGSGVIPDEEITHTRAALLAGRDLILEAAIGWIMSESR